MSQSHLVIDFPIKGPANAKALPEELPPLMPDLAKAQDDLGTVHFSRFMVEGDEKLLFLSDIDGETDQHIERLVESAGPVFDAIFEHVDDPPATPVADNPRQGHQMAEASCPRASRRRISRTRTLRFRKSRRARVRRASTGNTSQGTLLTYMAFQVTRCEAFGFEAWSGVRYCMTRRKKRRIRSGRLHLRALCAFRKQPRGVLHGLSTAILRSTSRTSRTRRRSPSMRSFQMSMARRQPQ